MKSSRLFRRWQRRKQRLLTELHRLLTQCRAEGTPDQIHDLRVTLRRPRLFVRVGRPVMDPAAVMTFRRWARGISKATSRVRDWDVALEWLATQPGTGAWARLGQERRHRLWRSLQARIQPTPAGLLVRLSAVKRGPQAERRLAKRWKKLARRYEDLAQEEALRFFRLTPEQQHEFRRTLRWWRYLQELVLRGRDLNDDVLLKGLVAVQEATGDRQNLALAERALKPLVAAGDPAPLRLQIREAQKLQARKIEETVLGLARLRRWKPSGNAG